MAEKAKIRWKKTKGSVTFIDGFKSPVIDIAEEVNLKITDQPIPIQMQIVDSDRNEILIEGNWLEKYQANLILTEGKITFRANGWQITVKIVKYKGKITSKWTQLEGELEVITNEPPPQYQPTIVIESDSKEEDETPILNWTEINEEF